MPVTELMPPDFEPRWTTRLRLWRAHKRLHQSIRRDLISQGVSGQSMDCAHCNLGWIVRQAPHVTYLREVRRGRRPGL
jgi:hypothetical protein